MVAGPLDHFCLKNQWKIKIFGSNMSLRVPSVCRTWLGCQEARLAGLAAPCFIGFTSPQESVPQVPQVRY